MKSAIKYIAILASIIFIFSSSADAFTAMRPEEYGSKPMTRAQKRAIERAKAQEESASQEEEQKDEEIVFHHDGVESESGDGGAAGGTFVHEETPTPTPTVTETGKSEEQIKQERSRNNMIVIILALLMLGGVGFWYFTRNVNFKKMGGGNR